jgi:rSAM/selenodomain-associated transferase 2
MKLSIVVPVLNEADQITALLQGLAPLRAQGCEVLVVDGGSSDDTVRLAGGHADTVIQSPRGRAAQMNAGAAAASGELLLFLHADTRLPDFLLDFLSDRLRASGRVWGRFDIVIDGRPRMLPLIAALVNLRSRLTGIATGDQAIFVWRATFQALGGFPAQSLMEDIELSRRLKRLSPPLCLREKARTSGRRWERDGVWRTVWLMWRLRLWYRLGASPEALAKAYR